MSGGQLCAVNGRRQACEMRNFDVAD